MTQRLSKVPIHYRDKLNTLLKELEKHNVIKQIGSSPHGKPTYGTTYLNSFIIIPKGDSIKCVLDARHLNSNTDQSDELWPVEPFAPQLHNPRLHCFTRGQPQCTILSCSNAFDKIL